MIITSIVMVNKPPTLSLHEEMVKLDFGSCLLEIDVEGFKNLIASMIMEASAQGINFLTK